MKLELKILFSLSAGLFTVAIFMLGYSFHSARYVAEPASEILSSAETARFGEAFGMLSSLHIFTNIDGNPPPPNEKIAEVYSGIKDKMLKNSPLTAEEKKFLADKISYYLSLAGEMKLPSNNFNEDDREPLKLLLEFRKTANHNSFIFGFFTTIASIVIFIAGILFHFMHRKNPS
ncbi:MAG: hypothetical protein FJ088_06960 [Deltaproteobacteria bacterium]|nr:hypothetical protein [Deltaproteobacteria bacterium]